MLIPGQIYIARGPWSFGDFWNIFLPKIDEDREKVLTSERRALGTVSCGKSGHGYYITFIKRLDEGLR